MQETLAELLTYVRMVWRHRWLALGGAFLISFVGWTAVFMLPDKYEVSTKVFLDTRSLLRPVLKGLAVDSNVREDTVNMMRRTLLSRPNLESVARSTDMDLNVDTPEQFEKLLAQLADDVRVSGTVKDNIFNISYSGRDPKLTTRIVETLLNIFVEKSLGETRKDTSKTRDFLDQQIREYEAKLEAAEARLKEFKRKNIGLMPGEGQTYFSRREDVKKMLDSAKLELEEALSRREVLQAQLEGVEPTFGVTPLPTKMSDTMSGFVSELDPRIKSLQERLDNLLLQYTDKHPDVISTRELLDSLRARRKEEAAEYQREQRALAANAGPVSDGAMENPVFQELRISLGNVEAEVAALQARVAEYERRDAELKRLVDTIPKVEAELQALNRDYEIDSKNYDELVRRRESLKLSDEAEKTTDAVQFNIIEPPRVPLSPSSPNRPLLNSAVLVLGFGGGIAVAWFFAMIRPAFYTKEQIMNFTDLPVLGSVIRISGPRDILKRRMGYMVFGAGCLVLVLALVGLNMMESGNHGLVGGLLSGVS